MKTESKPYAYPGVVWTSSNPAVATVSSEGDVVGVKNGTVTITASADGNKDTIKVKVSTPKYVMTQDTSWGDTSGYEYNAFGQVIYEKSSWATTETSYNEYGLPTLRVEYDEYDSFSRTSTSYQYDDLMNVTEESTVYSDHSGRTIKYEYDAYGRRILKEKSSFDHEMDPPEVDESIRTTYDEADNGALTVTETVTDYWADGDWDTKVNVYVYNAKGLLTKKTEDDLTTTYTYDKKGRLTRVKKHWNGVTSTYTYNKKGLLSKVVTKPYIADVSLYKKCTVTYTYDKKKRQTRWTEVYGKWKNVTVDKYRTDQNIAYKSTSTHYKKVGKKYKKLKYQEVTKRGIALLAGVAQ